MNVLVCDIGNTNTTATIARDGELVQRFSCATNADAGENISAWLKSLADAPQHAVVASVVLPVAEGVETILSRSDIKVLRLDPAQHEILPHKLTTPQTTGVDRLCAARGAWELVRDAAIIIDAGTAVTVDVVDAQGTFLGGAILPGAQTWLNALSSAASAIPEVDANADISNSIGDNTKDALLSGVNFGLAGAIERLVREHRRVVGLEAPALLTGGGADALEKTLCLPVERAADLTLRGALSFANEYWAATE